MKFKAFTLLELIIASLITGVIGFIIIYFLQDILMVTKIQQAAKQQEEDLAVFDLLLTNDLFLSDTFYFRNGNLEIIKDTTLISIQQNSTAITYIKALDTAVFYLPIDNMRLNTTKGNRIVEIAYNFIPTPLVANYIDEADYLK